jgi:hypothetical protein
MQLASARACLRAAAAPDIGAMLSRRLPLEACTPEVW